MGFSLAERLALVPAPDRQRVLGELDDSEAAALLWDWRYWARPEQIAPDGDWFVWLILTGRGWGKTRSGSHWVHERAMAGNEERQMLLVSKTPADARDDMIQGLGGILRNVPPGERPEYEPAKRLLTWPTGAEAHIRSGANPDDTRGFSGDTVWCDELPAWRYPRECWDNILFGLREARVEQPRICVTTTPRPIPLIKQLVADAERGGVVLVRGSTYDNRANLSEVYYREVIAPREGTTLGRQEIHGEIIDEIEGASWSRALIPEPARRTQNLRRVVVGVDPSGSADGHEVGIVCAGVDREGRFWVLEDASAKLSPEGWATEVVRVFDARRADRVVAEKNFGGDMVSHVLRTHSRHLPITLVSASRGKAVRAEPVVALYEQGRVSHEASFPELEDQMCTARLNDAGDKTPDDRVDALVWALTELMRTEQAAPELAVGAIAGGNTGYNPHRIE